MLEKKKKKKPSLEKETHEASTLALPVTYVFLKHCVVKYQLVKNVNTLSECAGIFYYTTLLYFIYYTTLLYLYYF